MTDIKKVAAKSKKYVMKMSDCLDFGVLFYGTRHLHSYNTFKGEFEGLAAADTEDKEQMLVFIRSLRRRISELLEECSPEKRGEVEKNRSFLNFMLNLKELEKHVEKKM